MIALLALLLSADTPHVKESIQPVTIAPGKYRNLAIRVDRVPYRVQAEFKVLDNGPRIRALLLTAEQASAYWNKRPFRAEAVTSHEREGFIGCWLTVPGEYEFILDNRLESRLSARVELNVGYVRGVPLEQARSLPAGERHRIVALSLLLFACLAGPAGYAVMRSFRRSGGPPR